MTMTAWQAAVTAATQRESEVAIDTLVDIFSNTEVT